MKSLPEIIKELDMMKSRIQKNKRIVLNEDFEREYKHHCNELYKEKEKLDYLNRYYENFFDRWLFINNEINIDPNALDIYDEGRGYD